MWIENDGWKKKFTRDYQKIILTNKTDKTPPLLCA